jgi:hypothetical protein
LAIAIEPEPALRGFGAAIRVALPEADSPGMFIVRVHGAAGRIAGVVHAAGGRTVMRYGAWLLVELPVAAGFALRRQPEVSFVGPVRLDAERLRAMGGAIQIARPPWVSIDDT